MTSVGQPRTWRIFTSLIVCVFVTLIAGTASSAAQDQSGSSILQTFSGKSLSLSCGDGTKAVGRYTMTNSAGKLTGLYSAPNEEPSREVGNLRAAGDMVCLTFRKLDDGAERCFGVVQMSPNQYTFTVAAGLVSACNVIVS
jgi:hypothetical protein